MASTNAVPIRYIGGPLDGTTTTSSSITRTDTGDHLPTARGDREMARSNRGLTPRRYYASTTYGTTKAYLWMPIWGATVNAAHIADAQRIADELAVDQDRQ